MYTRVIIIFALLLNMYRLHAQQQPLFRFGVIADVQYADQDNKGSRYYRLSPGKLKQAVDTFNQQKVDFVLSLGDYIDRDYKSFDTLNAIMSGLSMPVRHVLGNHDFGVGVEQLDYVLPTMGLKKPYYSFVWKGWRFIQLNGNDVSVYGNKPGTEKYKQARLILDSLIAVKATNAFDWNGAMGKDQLSWLKDELAKAQEKKEKVILSSHFPLYPDEQIELLWNARAVRSMIESFPNVIAYLNGHVHASQYRKEQGIHYISFRGMVEREENAFAIVSVYSSHIEITGYGKEISRQLK